jgi:hypothetical protein
MSEIGKHIELGGTAKELEESGSRFCHGWFGGLEALEARGPSRDTHVRRGSSIYCGLIYGDWLVELDGITVLGPDRVAFMKY